MTERALTPRRLVAGVLAALVVAVGVIYGPAAAASGDTGHGRAPSHAAKAGKNAKGHAAAHSTARGATDPTNGGGGLLGGLTGTVNSLLGTVGNTAAGLTNGLTTTLDGLLGGAQQTRPRHSTPPSAPTKPGRPSSPPPATHPTSPAGTHHPAGHGHRGATSGGSAISPPASNPPAAPAAPPVNPPHRPATHPRSHQHSHHRAAASPQPSPAPTPTGSSPVAASPRPRAVEPGLSPAVADSPIALLAGTIVVLVLGVAVIVYGAGYRGRRAG